MPTLRAALVVLPLLAPTARAQEWSNLGGNAARNGFSPELGPTAATLAWSATSDFSIIAWQPFVAEGRVLVVRESGFPQAGGPANDAILALDLDTGVELWRTTLPYMGDPSQEWIAWIAGARDGRVYASRSSNGQPAPLHALDAATGALLWTSTHVSQAFAYDGVVFAPNGDPILADLASVARLDAVTGAAVWVSVRSCPVSGACGAAATATALFVDEPAPGGNQVTKLDLATGATLYTSPLMPGFTDQNTPFLSHDGATVYFARTQNNVAVDFLYAFADDGTQLTQLWSRPVRWTTTHEHGIGPDGSIYTLLDTDELVRLDPATGAVLDSAGVLAPLGNPSPKTVVDGAGNVYVSNGWASTPASNGRLWAFTQDLSTNLFTLTLDRPNQGGPALGAGGTLVVADRTGVYAYRTERPGAVFCAGDAQGAGCPCGNDSPAAGSGCLHSGGLGMRLAGSGTASVAADDFTLTALQCPPMNSGIFFAGKTPFAGNPLYDGLQCAGGDARRFQGLFQSTGTVSDTGFGAQDPSGIYFAAGDVVHFQYWCRDVAAGPSPCGTGANLSDGWRVTMTP